MPGRIFVWINLFICVVAILGDWTVVGKGVAAQHQERIRQDGYQSTSDLKTVNTAADDQAEIQLLPVRQQRKEKPLDPTFMLMGIGKRKLSSSAVDGHRSTSDRETANTAANDHPDIQLQPVRQKRQEIIDPRFLGIGLGKRKLSSSAVDGHRSTSDRDTANTAANDHPDIQLQPVRQQRQGIVGPDYF